MESANFFAAMFFCGLCPLILYGMARGPSNQNKATNANISDVVSTIIKIIRPHPVPPALNIYLNVEFVGELEGFRAPLGTPVRRAARDDPPHPRLDDYLKKMLK
jgi:hypothetical protein